MELCSVLHSSLDGRGVWGRMDTFCMDGWVPSLFITTLLLSSTPTQIKKLKKKKKMSWKNFLLLEKLNIEISSIHLSVHSTRMYSVKLAPGTRGLGMNKKNIHFPTKFTIQGGRQVHGLLFYSFKRKTQQLRKFDSTCSSPSIILSSWMRSSLDNSKDFLLFRSLSPDGFRCRLTVPEAMTSSSFLLDLFFFFVSSERLLSAALLMVEVLGQETCPLDELSPPWFRDRIPTYSTWERRRCLYHHWNDFCLTA